jgi:hypothetical protein
MQTLHRARNRLVGERTALINQLRAQRCRRPAAGNRMHKNAALVALANKLARIVWVARRRDAAFDASVAAAWSRSTGQRRDLPIGR